MYNDTIYAGCHQGLWVSKDWGETWIYRSLQAATILTLDFIGNILIEGETIGVFYSRTFGFGGSNSWNEGLFFPGTETKEAGAYPIKDSIVYACLYYSSAGSKDYKCRLYCSTDTAKTFTRFWLENDTSKNIVVNSFFSDGSYAFALTQKGIYRRIIYEGTTIENDNAFKSYHKNCNNIIKISNESLIFSTHSNSRISFAIYTINGKLINIKNTALEDNNTSTFSLSTQNLPNGIYFVRLLIGKQISIYRFMVQR